MVAFVAGAPSREAIAAFQLSSAAHERLRTLLDRNATGTLSPEDERELDQVILLDDILSRIRAGAERAQLR